MPRRGVGPVPRAWLRDSEDRDDKKDGWRKSPFGRAEQPKWKVPKPGSSSDWADLRAAMAQHRFARYIREAITRQQTSVEVVAAKMSMSPDGLRRILGGTAHVTLTDLSRIAGALDREIQLTLHKLPPTELTADEGSDEQQGSENAIENSANRD